MSTAGRPTGTFPEDSDDEVVAELWRRYKADGTRDARDQLTLHYQPLVKQVADRVAVGAPRHVDRSDLASFGLFGLLDAIDKFDPGRGFKFETYAISRIRGAILDELRAIDWVPRRMRARGRAIQRAESELGNRLLRSPSDDELTAELGIIRAELHHTKILLDAGRGKFFDERVGAADDGVDGALVDAMSTGADPYQDFDSKEGLKSALNALTEREQFVLESYYFGSMTLAEIGTRLGVTESRVCQIHRKAIGNLRARLAREEQRLAVR